MLGLVEGEGEGGHIFILKKGSLLNMITRTPFKDNDNFDINYCSNLSNRKLNSWLGYRSQLSPSFEIGRSRYYVIFHYLALFLKQSLKQVDQ